MANPVDQSLAARALDLASAALVRNGAPAELPSRLLVVDVERQRAVLIEDGEARGAWPVSTARAGIGGTEGSYRTPPGWHRVHRRIGEGAEPGTMFVSREAVKRLVSMLISRKLLQVVPIAGAVVGAGFNYLFVTDVGETARQVYRRRFVTDKARSAERSTERRDR